MKMLLGVLLSFSLSALCSGQCTPVSAPNPNYAYGFDCLPGDQSVTLAWDIRFPDGYSTSAYANHTGQCQTLVTCGAPNGQQFACGPRFGSPQVSDGLWQETSSDSQASVVGTSQCSNPPPDMGNIVFCQDSGTPQTISIPHNCPSGGGGGGDGGGGGCQQLCGSTTFCPGAPCGNGGTQYCCVDSGGYHPCCPSGSPIIIDTANEGFHLTGLTNGVKFRERPGHPAVNISWTDSRFHNAWLALDRNGNGYIDDLTELFGNFTAQPPSNNPNGFEALAVFDDPRNGGNGNGVIDPGDAVYSSLRLWVDSNHDGVSQPGELFTLPAAGVFAINLTYVRDERIDQFGNQFRYRSSLVDFKPHSDLRCYDVFLIVATK